MVGWHHRFNGHKLEQTPEDSEEQGSLACCSPWGCKYKRKVGDFFLKKDLEIRGCSHIEKRSAAIADENYSSLLKWPTPGV